MDANTYRWNGIRLKKKMIGLQHNFLLIIFYKRVKTVVRV
jgi:hypothetical protein